MSLSFTKTGPGRRPAHVSKARALFDRCVRIQKQAQKQRAAKKKGHGWFTMENRATGASWPIYITHDDVITMRNGMVYASGNLVA